MEGPANPKDNPKADDGTSRLLFGVSGMPYPFSSPLPIDNRSYPVESALLAFDPAFFDKPFHARYPCNEPEVCALYAGNVLSFRDFESGYM
jgi:hypothetical protein